jgi:hypothetical protein
LLCHDSRASAKWRNWRGKVGRANSGFSCGNRYVSHRSLRPLPVYASMGKTTPAETPPPSIVIPRVTGELCMHKQKSGVHILVGMSVLILIGLIILAVVCYFVRCGALSKTVLKSMVVFAVALSGLSLVVAVLHSFFSDRWHRSYSLMRRKQRRKSSGLKVPATIRKRG